MCIRDSSPHCRHQRVAYLHCYLPGALTRMSQGGKGRRGKGKCRSSVDAREPQNPTKSEEYQRHLQGVLYIV
eukprot:814498-Pyramimonas_sp.AAC.1